MIISIAANDSINLLPEQIIHILRYTFSPEFLAMCNEQEAVALLSSLLDKANKEITEKILYQGEVINNPEILNPIKAMKDKQLSTVA